jgi:hypothetical protein
LRAGLGLFLSVGSQLPGEPDEEVGQRAAAAAAALGGSGQPGSGGALQRRLPSLRRASAQHEQFRGAAQRRPGWCSKPGRDRS